MRIKNLLIFILIIKGIIFAQDQATLELADSVVIYGNLISKTGVDVSAIDVTSLSNLSAVSYDLLSSLSLIGASYQSDFNVVPLLEGADFQEQEFLIENIPSSFPINLLGIQSGLNSLLFSSLTVERNLSNKSFKKSIMLNAGIRKFNNNDPFFASKTSNLRTENLLSIPLHNIRSNIILGYSRSLLESMKPLYDSFIKNRDFDFQSFPFYQGFQSIITTNINNIKMTQLLMTNYNKGKTRINSKDFNFKSRSLSIGSKIELIYKKSTSELTIHYLEGKNDIDYSFDESSRGILGAAKLANLSTGFDLNTKIFLNNFENILFSMGYKYEEGNSKNESTYYIINEKVSAKYNLHNYEFAFGYQRLLLKNIFFSVISGMTHSSFKKVGFFSNFDFSLNIEQNLDFNLVVDYKTQYIPTNAILYTFQNSIWDPSSVNTLYFIDQKDLPIKPIRFFNITAYLKNKFITNLFISDLQLKVFYRHIENLIFSNNYPLEANYYNTDFSFNQDYDAHKYGAIVSYSQYFPNIALTNRIALSLTKSLNINTKMNIVHNALNYNPIAITDIINWRLGDLSISSFMIYKLGRYIFNKSLEEYYSFSDSSSAYSLKTDFSQQKNLNPQFRFDITFNYLLLREPLGLDVGFSVINVFNSAFESNRLYDFDPKSLDIVEKSEFTNLPRFFIININLNYTF